MWKLPDDYLSEEIETGFFEVVVICVACILAEIILYRIATYLPQNIEHEVGFKAKTCAFLR